MNLNVTDVGSGSPALIFLHYWGGTSRTWSLVISALSDHHRCLALDLLGWGESDKAGQDYSLEFQADHVARLIESLHLPGYVLVGHSMGGKISQIIAARRPPGLGGLILVAPAPPTPMAAPAEQRRMMLESYQTAAGVESALSVLAERPLSAAFRQQVIDDTLGGAPAAKRAWTEHGMTLDISDAVKGINVPAVVIVGDRDRVENPDVLRREIGSRVSGTEFVILSGVGHLSPLEAPTELAGAIAAALSKFGAEEKKLSNPAVK